MRFRLVYEGELKSGQKDPEANQHDRLAQHKQSIRKVFHRQLKHLWQTNKFLSERKEHPIHRTADHRPVGDGAAYFGPNENEKIPLSDYTASLYEENGYRFVPLVREETSLLCSLNILFLRRDTPGSVISAGDLDNRIKTLIDALRRPKSANELRGNEIPAEGESPFYCLLEDDNLVTQLTVETDTLLDPPLAERELDRRQVKLIITVELKPYNVTLFNLSFS
ncbi:hypothetical protein [Afipia sp. DC4300-2b1]|uniref:hypothetical protein n=1 Tax=Afipia sp. DC4300-2b1 TaxID=2804672 RepID=UPI003CF10360